MKKLHIKILRIIKERFYDLNNSEDYYSWFSKNPETEIADKDIITQTIETTDDELTKEIFNKIDEIKPSNDLKFKKSLEKLKKEYLNTI